MQHIKLKGNDNKKIFKQEPMKGYLQLCVSGMTGDRSHQAKTTKHIQQKTSKKKISTLKKGQEI